MTNPQRFFSLILASWLLASFALAEGKISAQAVQQRIDNFDEIEQNFKALRFKLVNQKSTDATGAKEMSQQMLNLAYKLPPLFSQVSSRQKFSFSRSKPEIWTRNALFKQQLNEFIDDLEEIDELLDTQQLAAAAKVIDKAAQGCRRCHNGFRYR